MIFANATKAIIAQMLFKVTVCQTRLYSETAIIPNDPVRFNIWYKESVGLIMEKLDRANAPTIATVPYHPPISINLCFTI